MWLLFAGIIIGLLISIYVVHRLLRGMYDGW